MMRTRCCLCIALEMISRYSIPDWVHELNLREPDGDDVRPDDNDDNADDGTEDDGPAVADKAVPIVSLHNCVTNLYMGSWLS